MQKRAPHCDSLSFIGSNDFLNSENNMLQMSDPLCFTCFFPECFRSNRVSFGGELGFAPMIGASLLPDEGSSLETQYLNARHLIAGRCASRLPREVLDFFLFLIDEYFPLGIPRLEVLVYVQRTLLDKIALTNEDDEPDESLSEEFFELVPHKGDHRRRPILNAKTCHGKAVYVNIMTSALRALMAARASEIENPIDGFLRQWIHTELSVLEDGTEYQTLQYAVQATQHPNARNFRVETIFRVNANHPFTKSITENHCYLYHFSFPSNLLGILRDGLLVAPEHIYSVNRFLGRGICFWNAVANAGLQYPSLRTVYILVCRVALGRIQTHPYPSFRTIEEPVCGDDVNSVFRAGTRPGDEVRGQEKKLNGASIFCGKIGEQIAGDRWEAYDVFAVPNRDQVKVEYILKLVTTD